MPTPSWDFDFIVVGSGFGGSVSAHRLTEKGYKVAVIEMGLRWAPKDFPTSNWQLSRWIWRPRLNLRGFFNITAFRHVVILHGCAVGGGSITYANTMLTPRDSIWESRSWAGLVDWKAEMVPHYAEAARMLGVTENRVLGSADRILKRLFSPAETAMNRYRVPQFHLSFTGIKQNSPSTSPQGAMPGPNR